MSRVFASRERPTRAQLLEAPVHWPRPSVLDASLQVLDGVGPKLAEAAAETGIRTIWDLMMRLPHSHRDRQVRLLAAVEPGETATVLVEVLGKKPRPFRAKRQCR